MEIVSIINLTTPMSDDKERERHTKAVIDAIEQYTEERMDDGNTDGSRSGEQPTQSDALREALEDLLHAVCGEKGFAECVRRDSGRIYPWPALDLAEAKAIAALERSK